MSQVIFKHNGYTVAQVHAALPDTIKRAFLTDSIQFWVAPDPNEVELLVDPDDPTSFVVAWWHECSGCSQHDTPESRVDMDAAMYALAAVIQKVVAVAVE